MNSKQAVGILGLGTYLPANIRKNDWWSEAVRSKWKDKAKDFQPDDRPTRINLSDGVMAVAAAIGESRGDPFYGAVERRVVSDGMMSSAMETLAARQAVERAGIDAKEIDLVLGGSLIPDYIGTPNACAVHRDLGLKKECVTLAIDNVCNSFLSQLLVAETLIQAGRARVALLCQSCVGSAFALPEHPQSAWFGDGATAVVVGAVSEGHGILAGSHRSDGRYHDAMVGGVPGGRWFDEGRFCWYPHNRERAKEVLLSAVDNGREVVHAALQASALAPDDVDYFACHQPTPWFGRVCRDVIGLSRSRHLDTFSWTASLSSANVPFQLAAGEKEGMLKPGDVVAAYSGGSGITWSGVVLRWGR